MAHSTESSEHGHGSAAIPVSIGAMLVTLGVVYGDIGTSPMYVTKALLAGQGGSQGESHWLGAATGGDELFLQKLYVNVLCHNQRTPFSSLPSVGLFIVADLHSL